MAYSSTGTKYHTIAGSGGMIMEDRAIYITAFDRKRLTKLITDSVNNSNKVYLNELAKELERSKEVDPQDIPEDVITMNSKVRLVDTDSGEEMEYKLVFPADADLKNNKISNLAFPTIPMLQKPFAPHHSIPFARLQYRQTARE